MDGAESGQRRVKTQAFFVRVRSGLLQKTDGSDE
jgi:hypothetical protein